MFLTFVGAKISMYLSGESTLASFQNLSSVRSNGHWILIRGAPSFCKTIGSVFVMLKMPVMKQTQKSALWFVKRAM